MACDANHSNHTTANDPSDCVVSDLSVNLLLCNLFLPPLLVLSIQGVPSSKLLLQQPAWLFLNHKLIVLDHFWFVRHFSKEGLIILLFKEFLFLISLSVYDLASDIVDWSP